MEEKEKIAPEPTTNPKPLKRKRLARIYGWKIATIILLILLIFSIYTEPFTTSKKISKEEAVERVNDFLKLDETSDLTAIVDDIIERDNVYEVKISITMGDFTQKTTAHLTKDGKLFFPQSVDLNEVTKILEAMEEIEQREEEIIEEPEIIVEEPEEINESGMKVENLTLTIIEEEPVNETEETNETI